MPYKVDGAVSIDESLDGVSLARRKRVRSTRSYTVSWIRKDSLIYGGLPTL